MCDEIENIVTGWRERLTIEISDASENGLVEWRCLLQELADEIIDCRYCRAASFNSESGLCTHCAGMARDE